MESLLVLVFLLYGTPIIIPILIILASIDIIKTKTATWLSLILLLGLVFIFTNSTENWKEEVQLSDGQVITISRETVRTKSWKLDSLSIGGRSKTYRLYFKDSNQPNKVIEWHSIKKVGNWPEEPMILDREEGAFVVFSESRNNMGCTSYSKYQYLNNTWIEEPLPISSPERTANLLDYYEEGMPGHITLAIKEKRNARGDARRYNRVGSNNPRCP